MSDLAGLIRMRLENAGVLMIDDVGVDTYSDERFIATGARCTGRSRITAGTFMRLCSRRDVSRSVSADPAPSRY
jgi:hypothetical protein